MKSKKKNQSLIIVVVLLALLLLSKNVFTGGDHLTTDVPDGSSFQVDYIDVGQGDSELVSCDGHYMLIDGGDVSCSSLMYSYLQKRGISNLDVVVCTHAHDDHVGGLSGALHYASASTVYCPVTRDNSNAFTDFVNTVESQGVTITVPKAGDSFNLGSALVQIIAPLSDYSDTNDTSIVLKVTYGQTSFLFTGDAAKESVDDLMSSGYDLYCTVLKVGHHGSEASTPARFLLQTQPKYAVISCGKDNPYGHPHKEVLERLSNAGVTVYRTDLNGTVTCKSDGKDVTFTTEKGSPTEPETTK